MPALPLLFRFLYASIASASRSRTRFAIGESTDAAAIDCKPKDATELEGIGDTVVKELAWLSDGEEYGGGNLELEPLAKIAG